MTQKPDEEQQATNQRWVFLGYHTNARRAALIYDQVARRFLGGIEMSSKRGHLDEK